MNLEPIRKAKWARSQAASNGLNAAQANSIHWEALELRQMLSAALSTVTPALTLEYVSPSAKGAASSVQGYTPAQIKSAYGFSGLSETGAGQTIAIVDAFNDPNITADLGTFDSQFGLAAPPSLKIVSQTGSSKLPATNAGWAQETALDVEWAHAIAPQANILLVEATTDSTANLLKSVNYARSASGVSVVSMSWGGSEMSNETSDDKYFTTPSGHTGVTFVAAAGDEGADGGAEWPASSPNVLAVGGTTLNLTGSTYTSETTWSDTSDGTSSFEKTPTYQSSLGVTSRTTADVSYDADPNTGFATYDSLSYQGEVGWAETGGTSAGTPQWAGLIALSDQGRVAAGRGTLDGATATLPALYSVYANATTYANDFNDIASGSNGDGNGGGGFGGGGFGGGGFGGGGFGGGGFGGGGFGGGGFGGHHHGGRFDTYAYLRETSDAASTSSSSVSLSSATTGYDGPTGLGTPKAAGLVASLVAYGATTSAKTVATAKTVKADVSHLRPALRFAPPPTSPLGAYVAQTASLNALTIPNLNRPEPRAELDLAVGLARPSSSAAATADSSSTGALTSSSLSGFVGEQQSPTALSKVTIALKPAAQATAVVATAIVLDARQAAGEIASTIGPLIAGSQQIFTMNHIDANATFGDALSSFTDELASIPRVVAAGHSNARAWIVTGLVLVADAILIARYRMKRAGTFNDRVKIAMCPASY